MLILGSGSPRRQAILTDLGLSFTTVNPLVDEIHHNDAPSHTVRENAKRKLNWCSHRYAQDTIICADTVVVFNNKALGKPSSFEEAQDWLLSFSGAQMDVITAIAYYNGTSHIVCDTTTLQFKEFSQETVTRYYTFVSYADKAGGFNIDEKGDLIIASINGSYSNVMGLCKERVQKLLSL